MDRIQRAEDDDWSNDQRQDNHCQAEAYQKLFPEGLRLAKLVVHIGLVGALGQVQVRLNLR